MNKKEAKNATLGCEVMTFQFSESKQPVRNVLINGTPWFVARDVCDVLGLKDTNMSLKPLDDDEKLTQKILGSGQTREMWLISESGLYALVLRSNKPYAKTFRKWITSEVIPELLRKGSYGMSHPEQKYDYIDARSMPYHTQDINGYNVRCIDIGSGTLYSLNDLNRALQSSTGSSQLARKLNAQETLAVKVLIFGNTHPAWFTNGKGARLVFAGSRRIKGNGVPRQLNLPEGGML
jgi:prophage antirepressor-like protein